QAARVARLAPAERRALHGERVAEVALGAVAAGEVVLVGVARRAHRQRRRAVALHVHPLARQRRDARVVDVARLPGRAVGDAGLGDRAAGEAGAALALHAHLARLRIRAAHAAGGEAALQATGALALAVVAAGEPVGERAGHGDARRGRLAG